MNPTIREFVRLVITGLLATAIAACSRHPPTGASAVEGPAGEAGEAVDPWRPISFTDDKGQPRIGSPCPSSEGRLAASIPPGVGHCLAPGAAHPYGYFTMNCAAMVDCPIGIPCDGGHCRAPCASDGDCLPPTRCVAGTGLARFCMWPESPGFCEAAKPSCSFDGENHNATAVEDSGRTVCPRRLARAGFSQTTMPSSFAGDAAIDAQGNVVALGVRPAIASPSVATVRRIGPGGQTLWEKPAPYGSLVASTATGEIFIAGLFSGTVDVGNSSLVARSTADAIVARWDASGAGSWAVSFFEERTYVLPIAMAAAPDGGVVVLWRRSPQPDPADFPHPPSIEWASVTRHSATGELLWMRKLPPEVGGRGLAIDRESNVFVSTTTSSGGVGPDFGSGAIWSPDRNLILVKLGNTGEVVWARSAGVSPDHNVSAVTVDGAGAIYLAGSAGEMRAFAFGISYALDAFVAAFDREGKLRWQLRVNDTQQSEASSVAIDPCGNVLLAGNAQSRAFVAQIDPTGVPRDFRQIARPSPNATAYSDIRAGRILADPSGGMLVVGSTRGAALVGGALVPNASDREHAFFAARWVP